MGIGVGGLVCTGDLGVCTEASSAIGEPLVKGLRKGLGFFSVGELRCKKGFVLGVGLVGEIGASEKGLNGFDDVDASSEMPFSEGKITRSNCPRSPQEKCVTVTGVGPVPFSSCLAAAGLDGGTLEAAGLVAQAAAAAATPPRARVSLSPP